eukprot:Tamp_31698.p1 GENE.Tamp_31698~~Tamp_31698.p1  ORF type:complete len:108 (-),score=32.22 Tamp_31698:276-599(-)
MFSSSWDVISCGADRSWKREKRGRAAWSRGSECILPLVLRVCGICCTRWRSAVKAREEEEEEEEKEIEEDEANAVNKEEEEEEEEEEESRTGQGFQNTGTVPLSSTA